MYHRFSIIVCLHTSSIFTSKNKQVEIMLLIKVCQNQSHILLQCIQKYIYVVVQSKAYIRTAYIQNV